MRIFTYKCYHQNQLIKTTTSWQEAKEWERSKALNYFLIECTSENPVETEEERAKRLATIAKRNERRVPHV